MLRTLTGSKSRGVGDGTFTGPGTIPQRTAALSHFTRYSYDGGGWINVRTAALFSGSRRLWETGAPFGSGPSRGTPVLHRVSEFPVRCRASPPTSWGITASPVRSCTEPRKGTDSYVAGNPSQCNGEGQWLDAGAPAQTDRYQVWYKTSNNPSGIWYHLTSGMAAGHWIRCDTSNLGCNPPNGMPNR
jgi:hypothetical protein